MESRRTSNSPPHTGSPQQSNSWYRFEGNDASHSFRYKMRYNFLINNVMILSAVVWFYAFQNRESVTVSWLCDQISISRRTARRWRLIVRSRPIRCTSNIGYRWLLHNVCTDDNKPKHNTKYTKYDCILFALIKTDRYAYYDKSKKATS